MMIYNIWTAAGPDPLCHLIVEVGRAALKPWQYPTEVQTKNEGRVWHAPHT